MNMLIKISFSRTALLDGVKITAFNGETKKNRDKSYRIVGFRVQIRTLDPSRTLRLLTKIIY
jgi:hypothetical protein